MDAVNSLLMAVLMVLVAGTVGFAIGIPLGILLFVTRPGQIEARPLGAYVESSTTPPRNRPKCL